MIPKFKKSYGVAKLIKSNGVHKNVTPTTRRQFTLEELQAYVGGQITYVRTDEPGMVFVVNETGLLKNLPVNQIATAMTRNSGEPAIVGDVLLGHRKLLGA